MLMLHGNPTWSFMYRDLIREAAAAGWRAVALDNLGSGLSDKPENWPYTLEAHIENLAMFIEHLGISEASFVMHDWGGPIGMGFATKNPDKVRSIVLMNTAAYLPAGVPKRLFLCRIPLLGAFLVRGLNLLVRTALKKAAAKKLPDDVRDGYCAPYSNWHDRIAVLKYPLDIPLSPKHQSYATFAKIETALPRLADKKIALLWGEKDFCLGMEYFNIWRQIYPNAAWTTYSDASHYLLEDKGTEILNKILELA